MTNTSEVGEWVERAGRLKLAGASSINSAELAAVHAGLFPTAEPVRTGCRKCLLDAWQQILRYLREQASPIVSTSLSTSAMSQNTSARFLSDDTQYFPFGLGVVVNNDNMTDKMARYILENDADAKALFKTLPATEKPTAPKAPAAPKTPAKPAAKAAAPAPKMAAVPADTAGDTDDADTDSAVKLTEELHRDELEAIYADEVKEGDPKAFANKGELIAAIEQFRASQAAQ